MLATVRSFPLSRQTLWRGALALVLLLVGAAAGLAVRSAVATHDDATTVHACVSVFTGQSRIMLPWQPPNCKPNERLVEWQSDTGTVSSGVAVASLQFSVPAGQVVTQDVSCANPGEVAVGGGVFTVFAEDIPFAVIHQSFRLDETIWRASVQNLDLNDSVAAQVQVFCVVTG